MIKRNNRTCHKCKQERPAQYYISAWQKALMIAKPWPYCTECAQHKKGLVLYREWIAVLGAMDGAARNEAQWS